MILTGVDRHPKYINASRNQVTASELFPGTWYNFTIFSRDAKGRRNEQGSLAINAETEPLAPANVRLRRATTDSYTIVWSEMWGKVVRPRSERNTCSQLLFLLVQSKVYVYYEKESSRNIMAIPSSSTRLVFATLI